MCKYLSGSFYSTVNLRCVYAGKGAVLLGQVLFDEGKKNFLADEGIKLKAQKLLFSEISVVFDIPEEEIPAFIESRLK